MQTLAKKAAACLLEAQHMLKSTSENEVGPVALANNFAAILSQCMWCGELTAFSSAS